MASNPNRNDRPLNSRWPQSLDTFRPGELAQLAGWQSYDTAQHGIAQRYLTLALDFAHAAGQTAHRAGLPALTAEAHVMQAHALAKANDERACATALHKAEQALDRADRSADPQWLSYFDEAYLSAKFGHCFTGVHDAAAAPAARTEATIQRLVRSTAVANGVKRLHSYRCQVCGLQLATPASPYAEAAHIRALGRPHNGPDVASNILCLCPNDHLLFDTGAI